MAVDFNKRLKLDRIKLFVDVVTKIANDTPAGGYAIGEAIAALPEKAQQFLLTEIPDKVVRREYVRRELNKTDESIRFEGADVVEEAYKEEVYKPDPLIALCRLLGIETAFPEEEEVIAEVLKLFPSRFTVAEFTDNQFMKEIGL